MARDHTAFLERDPEPQTLGLLFGLVEREFRLMYALLDGADRDLLASSRDTRRLLWRQLVRSTLLSMPPPFAARMFARLDEISRYLAECEARIVSTSPR